MLRSVNNGNVDYCAITHSTVALIPCSVNCDRHLTLINCPFRVILNYTSTRAKVIVIINP